MTANPAGTIRLRTPTLDDARSIGAIHVAAWQWAYRGLMPDAYLDRLDADVRVDEWAARLADDEQRRRVLAATVEDAVVGFVRSDAARDADASDMGEVHALYLDPEHLGCGIGRALFAAALDQLRAREHRGVVVWVLGTNERGRGFYERAGMRPDGAEKSIEMPGFTLRALRYHMELQA